MCSTPAEMTASCMRGMPPLTRWLAFKPTLHILFLEILQLIFSFETQIWKASTQKDEQAHCITINSANGNMSDETAPSLLIGIY